MCMKKTSKTQMAKNLGISRPTLYKKLKNGDKINSPGVKINDMKLCVHFSAVHNSINPIELENILESLQNYGFLNQDGIRFRSNYWELFIKEQQFLSPNIK